MRLDLSNAACKCEKAGCRVQLGIVDRHHRRHEALFVSAFRHTRAGQVRYAQFVRRYQRFRARDIVGLCREHHEYIHRYIYPPIITRHVRKTKRPLEHYTWRQAKHLMDQLGARCTNWLRRPVT